MDENKNLIQNKKSNSDGAVTSEYFDTWTLITEDSTSNLNKLEGQDDNSHVEIIKDDDIRCMDHVEELSDGISIISDSESAGEGTDRSSPLPTSAFEVLLKNKKIKSNRVTQSDVESDKITYEPVTPPNTPDRVDEKRYIVSTEKEDFHIEPSEVHLSNLTVMDNTANSFLTVRNGVSGFFYMCVLIAAIAFIGKLKYPEWESSVSESPINQRVDDLELQNNLLRAEIDILQKQVNFLNKQKDPNTKSLKYANTFNDKFEEKKKDTNYEDKLKVWPGGGNLEAAEIPKKALKTPHSCEEPGQNFKGICIEDTEHVSKKSENSENKDKKSYGINENAKKLNIINELNDFVTNKIDDVLHINTFSSNKGDDIIDRETFEKEANNAPVKEFKYRDRYKEEKRHKNVDRFKTDDKLFIEIEKDNNNYKSNENNYKKDEYSKKVEYSSKGEDFERGKHNDGKHKKKYDKYFEESKSKNGGHDRGGEWHDKMMKHREDYRKYKKDKHNKANWYMERGHGREEFRTIQKDEYKHKNDKSR